ncbi:MAG: DUF1080 domain-containing protein [Verrucomicrobia bacterium]|jgi:hypothetical protein|nr:DUF1080 domain-containing protein [Verrucomicrobiota bacterium]
MKQLIKSLLTLATVFVLIATTQGADQKSTPNTLTSKEKADGWRLLFDGKKIEGWRSYGKPSFPSTGWVIKEDSLHKVKGERPGDIMTADTFEDFELSWEWKLNPNGNSGIKYFIIKERKATVGHEYQMIDDTLVNDPFSSTASFYLIKPPHKDKPIKPLGTWNHSSILVKGNHVEHWLNGMKVLEYECGSPEVMNQVPKTKFRKWPDFGKKVRGHILLTDHSDPSWYRNIKIREF